MEYIANIESYRTKTDEKYLWILFFIFPLAALIVAIINFSQKNLRKFIWFFGILYGFTFIPIENSDADTYAKRFYEKGNYTFESYFNDITTIYSGEAVTPDVYATTLLFLSKKAGNNHQIFYVLASIFYYFMLLALLGTVWDNIQISIKYFYIFFFIGAVFILNLSAGLNGIRFPMAVMVFAYGTINLLLKGDRRYLLIAGLSVFVHFMMIYGFLILLVYYIVPLTRHTLVVLVLFSIALASTLIISELIKSNVTILGPAFEDRLTGYSNQNYIDQRVTHTQNWNWYVRLNLYATNFFVVIATLITKLPVWRLKFDQKAQNIFAFTTLLIISTFVTGEIVDPISNRYFVLVNLFGLVFLLYLSSINPFSGYLKIVSRLYIPILVLKILVIIRADLYTISPILIFGNPFLMLFYKFDVSIQELFLSWL